MENQHLEELIEKYILKTASIEEQQELLDWYNGYNETGVMWSSDQLNEETLVKRRLLLNINERIQPGAKKVRLWPRIAVAAAAVAAITLGVWLYYASSINGRHSDAGQNPGLAMNDVAPGRNTATLTLANGETITLSDKKTGVIIDATKLKYSDGTPIPSSLRDEVKQSQLLVASTPRGGTYQFTLPDGTKVWLNADSKLEFPSQFIGKQRKIILSGEAYFEVAKNKAKPFTVESAGQIVEVLGTHFNINSYADEGSTKTTLLEGSVSVSSLLTTPSLRGRTEASRGNLPGRGPSTTPGEAVTLKPGQQSVLTDNNRITVKQVDLSDALAWQKGYFMFNNETLESIMKRVARWYNVEVIYLAKETKNVTYYGTVSRFENISKVLSKLQATGNVKFKIEGNKIYISK
jgi:ferric-dicitrate binding protein FerR (iron transport regulator)